MWQYNAKIASHRMPEQKQQLVVGGPQHECPSCWTIGYI